MTAQKPKDLEEILPDAKPIEVAGHPCTVRRLMTREVLMLGRVLTAGLGPAMANIDLQGPAAQNQMVAALMMAIPNAPDETIMFLRAVLDPVDPDDAGEVMAVMGNPPFDVTMDIIVRMAEQEAETIQQLVGKGKAAVALLQKQFRTGA